MPESFSVYFSFSGLSWKFSWRKGLRRGPARNTGRIVDLVHVQATAIEIGGRPFAQAGPIAGTFPAVENHVVGSLVLEERLTAGAGDCRVICPHPSVRGRDFV